ncbi:hypothetical protein BHE74_00009246 [Ensete ventricosum]|uniref:GYF domain-containing protein n=1 Tax=Ensete ventricosum TaxID=4639 RepID=A0A445MCM1_ENSVE|nr:hypothetical protein BHE74_00009246 [Ensete ventricosum]RZR72030.1 hypothetical protein BHM03_00009784 [Ensete ventricosum]
MDCKSEDNPDIRINLVVGPVGLAPVVVDHDVVYDKPVSDGDILSSEINVGKIELVNVDGRSCLSDILKNIKLEGEDSTVSLDVSAKLPDESYPLFDASFEVPNTSKHEISKIEKKHLEQGTSLEELSLLYQDPQGDIQGPFLVVDIISWFEQGFFGTDLLVCLSDAPEGTPFQPLGEIMPHMKLETHTISDAPSAENVEAVETTRGDLDACVPLFQSSGSFITNGQQQVLSWDALGHHMQPNVVESEASVNPNKERLSFSISEAPLGTACVDRKIFHDFAGQDAEVTPNSNLKFLNAIARAQGPDGQGLLDHFHTPGQIGQFPSSAHPHQSEIFEFTGTHLDAAEKHWSEPSRQQPADLMQSHLKQLLLEAEKQRRGTNMIEDPNAWTSYAENDGNSEYGFRDLFHQEIPQSQHTKGLVVATATASYEQRDSSWIYSQPVFEHSFKLGPDRAGLNNVIEPSFSEMLKSTKKPMPELETLEAGSIGKGPKKRGKKGRQIDPSLLGFKVHSNRILMGEIQRPDD